MNRIQNIIPLIEELEFIKAYLFLYQIRYGSGISVQIEDVSRSVRLGLPPLTLQLLIENAIKHNVFSTDSPLRIHIYFPENNLLVVENNKMPKAVPELSTRMGLKNIAERYQLMNRQVPVVIDGVEFFRVEIRLIDLNN